MSKNPSSAQIRGARAMLGWSMTDLARAAGVSVAAVHRVQTSETSASPDATIADIKDALETKGVRFLSCDGSGPGIRLMSHFAEAAAGHDY